MACFCAVRDVSFAIDALALRDSFPVIAGDNLLDYSLSDFIAYLRKKQIACVMRYYEPGMKKLRKTGVTVVDEEGKILSMEGEARRAEKSLVHSPPSISTKHRMLGS